MTAQKAEHYQKRRTYSRGKWKRTASNIDQAVCGGGKMLHSSLFYYSEIRLLRPLRRKRDMVSNGYSPLRTRDTGKTQGFFYFFPKLTKFPSSDCSPPASVQPCPYHMPKSRFRPSESFVCYTWKREKVEEEGRKQRPVYVRTASTQTGFFLPWKPAEERAGGVPARPPRALFTGLTSDRKTHKNQVTKKVRSEVKRRRTGETGVCSGDSNRLNIL